MLINLFERWKIQSLRTKLLVPLVGLMLISLLGGTLAFVGGTASTRNQLLRRQVDIDAERVTTAMTTRVKTVEDTAMMLASDPEVVNAVQKETEDALSTLNSRALSIRDRFELYLIQIYNAQDVERVNLMLSSLSHESQMLDYVAPGTTVVQGVGDRMLLLSRAEMPNGAGTVVTGIDLEEELQRTASRYRLATELGLISPDAHVGTREDLPVDEIEKSCLNALRGNQGQYTQCVSLTLGDTPVELLLVRPTTDITRVTRTGLWVMIGSMVLTTMLLAGLSVGTTKAIAQPIQQLSSAAEAVAEGDLSQRVSFAELDNPLGIGHQDEIGLQAEAFNEMVAELRSLYGDLEAKVETRTQELAATAEVARAVSSSLELEAVLQSLVNLIRTELGFYHVALFLIEPGSGIAVLKEAAGEASERLKAEGFRFAVGSQSILGQAATTGEPKVAQHVRLEPVQFKVSEFPDVGSAAAIPLLTGGRVIGVLYTQHERPKAFTADVINLLVTLVDQIAVGVENARLYEQEQRRRHLAELLELTGRALSSSLDMDEVPERVLSTLDELIPYERGLVLLRDDGVLRPLAHYGFPGSERVRELRIPLGEDGVFEEIVRTRRPLILDDVSEEPGWQQLSWLPLHRSWMGMPIIAKDEVIGMVSLTRREASAFSLEDTTWVQAFAMHAGIALENAQLYAEIAGFNEHLEQLVRQRTAELDKAYRTLEQLDKTKSDFIQVISHELRTPITVIKAFTQLLEKYYPEAEKGDTVQEAFDGILSGVDRMHALVNDMLEVTKIHSQVLEMHEEKVSLRDVIAGVCFEFKPALLERRLELTTEGLEGLPIIQADPGLLSKVFYHLIINAIKYTPDGGAVTVKGFETETAGGAPAVEVVVSDTGIGIDPEHHELIFETFYQTGEVAHHSSGETKFKAGGPGLGLSIAQGIVLAHEGQIWVESEGCDEEACPGSDFHVRLPVGYDVTSATKPTAAKRERGNGRGGTMRSKVTARAALPDGRYR
jgi:signal transduction histidine kinase/HAMP domain-containing protein